MEPKIKILFMDVDGTLTDGKIYISNEGEIMKAFNAKDGYGIARLLKDYAIVPVIITGRNSKIVEHRCKEIWITEIYQGVHDKEEKLKEVANSFQCTLEECAYIGDDLNDLGCFEICGFCGCPNDAVDTIKKKSDYICKKDGGDGAVREFIECIILRNGGY
ncbi:MAG TPA: 3-deoxy-D-manno-octulosonate 8-phosphate phosphatase [Porphyromonadaceae bacterium]|nr:3-deoxy-D-manno-octulosonate 8-phosphate phosphatase [Porphyromonadaceae bacterium]